MRPERQTGKPQGKFPVQHCRRDKHAAVSDEGVEQSFAKFVSIAGFRYVTIREDSQFRLDIAFNNDFLNFDMKIYA